LLILARFKMVCREASDAHSHRGSTAAAAEVFLGRRQISQADTISTVPEEELAAVAAGGAVERGDSVSDILSAASVDDQHDVRI